MKCSANPIQDLRYIFWLDAHAVGCTTVDEKTYELLTDHTNNTDAFFLIRVIRVICELIPLYAIFKSVRQQRSRIDEIAEVAKLEVQMWVGGVAGGTDQPDDLSLAHHVALSYEALR